MAFDPGLAHVTDVAQVLPELVPAVGGDGMQQLLVHDDSFRLATAVRGVGCGGEGTAAAVGAVDRRAGTGPQVGQGAGVVRPWR